MKIHHLKCVPTGFKATLEGIKLFEFRKDDRDFQVGDLLILQEYIPPQEPEALGTFTGREITVMVPYIARNAFNIPEGYCVMTSVIKEMKNCND